MVLWVGSEWLGHSRKIVRDQETIKQVENSEELEEAFSDRCITSLIRGGSGAARLLTKAQRQNISVE